MLGTFLKASKEMFSFRQIKVNTKHVYMTFDIRVCPRIKVHNNCIQVLEKTNYNVYVQRFSNKFLLHNLHKIMSHNNRVNF
jgi:hypothetical protein